MGFLLDLRRRGIIDATVLKALEEVPRERFVEPGDEPAALADRALPIRCGQTISQPYVVALMTEALRVRPTDLVLEVGTGSGYQAAVLGRIARRVVSVERWRTLADSARERLAALGLANVDVVIGDGMQGVPEFAPYDRIMVTAAAPEVPASLASQLAPDGILVMPVGGSGDVQTLTRFVRRGDELVPEPLLKVRFVPLMAGVAEIL